MSEVPLTPAQRRAVERRDGPLLVAAGAGSGKTTVLVERFVRAVLDDGAAVDTMLAITFTEKAAAELAARVRARFVALGAHEQARAAEGAFISTIHGLCARLLRAHALAAGLDPEFEVLEALEAERIGVDAFDATLSAFLHDDADPERLALVAAYTPDRLERMVRTAYGHLRSRGQLAPELPAIEPPVPAGERERLEAAARAALAQLASAADGIRVEEARARLERCLALLDRTPPDGELDPAALEQLTVGRGAGALRTDALDAYRAALEGLRALATAQRELGDHTLLRQLLADYGGRYAEAKRRRSALDFDDLELLANELLRTDAHVRASWTGRFEHVLVDEYQDTNPLQNELIDRIAGPRPFHVGDESQSIYRFRHADVSVFSERARRARSAGALEALTTNFRSRPEILAAVDTVFGAVWGERFVALEPGRDPGPDGDGARVELIVADRPHQGSRWRERFEAEGIDPETAFGESLRGVAPARAAEARALARRVDELLGSGEHEPGDVVVLLRATTHLAAYERALEDRGIPTYAMGGRGYWAQQQVSDLRAYLAALANPLDELALYTALASPLAGMSLDGLVIVAAAARAAASDPWTVLCRLADAEPATGALGDDLGEADASRARAFVELLRSERAGAPRHALETLIDRAVTRSGYDRHLLAQRLGARRMANVRKLMRLAREFEAEAGRDVRAFIDFVAERDALGDRQGEAPLEPEHVQAVRLMTIHRAKGLEFPVVCVADLGKPGREDLSPLRISEDGSVGISLAQLGGGSIASDRLEQIRAAERVADEEEEKRTFYVALTRAEERLILSGATDLERLPEEKALEEPMRWIWRALVPELPGLDAGRATAPASGAGRPAVDVTVLRPDALDAVLPPADRAPREREPEPPGLDALAAPALAAVPVPAAPPLSRISYSSLQRYARCGYRFYLERALSLPAVAPPEPLGPAAPAESAGPAERAGPAEPPLVPGAPLAEQVAQPADALAPEVRGSIAHLLLEQLDLAAPVAPDPEQVRRLIARHGQPVRDPDVDDLVALVEGFAASPLRARIAAARRTRVELPFAFGLDPQADDGHGLLVNGIVDVYAEEADGVLVVDYKSDRLGEETPAQAVERAYDTQRLVYALAALRSGAERVEVVHAFLERLDEPASATYTAADEPALSARLRELAHGIVTGDFPPTQRPWAGLCADCPGRPGLCSWGPERTLAPTPE